MSPDDDSEPPVWLDPSTIRYSIPTLAGELPSLRGATADEAEHGLALHEDDWRQLEFLPAESLPHVQESMAELHAFEAGVRTSFGWDDIYVRKLPMVARFRDSLRLAVLQEALGRPEAPPLFLFNSSAVYRVDGGFAFPMAGDVALYGSQVNGRIEALAISVGPNAGDNMQVFRVFGAVSDCRPVILADWLQQFVVLGQSEEGCKIWRP
jgi:hypothetical protein